MRHIARGKCPDDVLVIDEVSQVDIALWTEIAKVAMLGKQFICLGDFFQFSPIGNSWKSSPIPEDKTEQSHLLRELCPHRLTLTENKRSDPPLFDWYSSLIPNGRRYSLPLEEILTEARNAFPVKEGDARWNLVLSHRKRVTINKAMNAKDKEGGVLIKANVCDGIKLPQDMYLKPGMVLIGCLRGNKPVCNGNFYEVTDVNEETVTLDSDIILSHAHASKCLRLTYAITYASCQGLSLPGVVRLHDCGGRNFTIKHLFVAMSRCTGADLLQVC